MKFRMTPSQFKPLERDLIETAKIKLILDLIEKVKNTNHLSANYNTDFATIKQCYSVREGLDNLVGI